MTARTVAHQLGVSEATLRRARVAANLPARTRAAPDYSEQEIALLRAHVSGKGVRAALREEALTERIADLEKLTRQLAAQLATQQELTDRLVVWGQHIARIVRELWLRMPDYRPGNTPGEFPAVHLEDAQMLQEEDQRTSAFFAELDQR